MPKVEISQTTLKALKVEAALRGISIQKLADDILTSGLDKKTIDFVKSSSSSAEDDLTNVQIEDCTIEIDEKRDGPLPEEDREITLKLLYKLKEIIEQKGQCTNRELVNDMPDVPRSGPYLHRFGIEQNQSSFYTRKLVPQIEAAIKELTNI